MGHILDRDLDLNVEVGTNIVECTFVCRCKSGLRLYSFFKFSSHDRTNQESGLEIFERNLISHDGLKITIKVNPCRSLVYPFLQFTWCHVT